MIFEITITMFIYLMLGILWTGIKHILAHEYLRTQSWNNRLRHMLFETLVWPYDIIDVFWRRT